MKILHCADIHLNSSGKTNLGVTLAKQRREETRASFERMLMFANREKVDIVLIVGDLFDTKTVDARNKKYVSDLFLSYPNLKIFLLKGNHDSMVFDEHFVMPKNVFMFGEEWTYYKEEEVVICGRELYDSSELTAPVLQEEDINIVLLHGDFGAGKQIDSKILAGKNIDILALGHIHSYSSGKLDKRGKYAYSGCLEARGYDETGEKGFVLWEIKNKKIDHEFKKFSAKNVHDIKIENPTREKIAKVLEKIDFKDIVRIQLVGEEEDSTLDARVLTEMYKDSFYHIAFEDKRKKRVQIAEGDISLRGKFVSLVQASQLGEEEKNRIVGLGLSALNGEELDI